MRKAFIVGWADNSTGDIRVIHETYEGALVSWNELRAELVQEALADAKRNRGHKGSNGGIYDECHERDALDYEKSAERLRCDDPDKLVTNCCGKWPYIHAVELRL